MSEAALERHLRRRVKHLGGEVRKVQWVGRRSAPDDRVMIPGRDPVWVELKDHPHFPRGAHERAQWREHITMRELGEEVVVLCSIQAIDSYF